MPPHSTTVRSILILSCHLSLGLPRGFFPSGLLPQTLYAPNFPSGLLPQTLYAPHFPSGLLPHTLYAPHFPSGLLSQTLYAPNFPSSLLSQTLYAPNFPSSLLSQTLYAPHLSPISATRPAQLILLDLITRIILGEEDRTLSSSLCSLLLSPATSSLLSPILDKPQPMFPSQCETKFYIHTKQEAKL